MSKTQVTMQICKQTKNTYVFKELDQNGAPVQNMYEGLIGQLYIKQSVFNGKRPDKITITIEVSD